MPKKSSNNSKSDHKEEFVFIACIKSDRASYPKSKLLSSISITEVNILYNYEIYLFKVDVEQSKGFYVRIVISPQDKDKEIILDDVFYLDQDRQKMLSYVQFIQALFPDCQRQVLMNSDKLSAQEINKFITQWKSQTQN